MKSARGCAIPLVIPGLTRNPALGPGFSPGRRVARGFTLIEVLIALAILAIALAATTRAASLATDSAIETRQRLLATWTAENRIAELRARRAFPGVGETRLTAENGGVNFVLRENVADTPNPVMRRVEIGVADARDPGRALATLTAYVSQQ